MPPPSPSPPEDTTGVQSTLASLDFLFLVYLSICLCVRSPRLHLAPRRYGHHNPLTFGALASGLEHENTIAASSPRQNRAPRIPCPSTKEAPSQWASCPRRVPVDEVATRVAPARS